MLARSARVTDVISRLLLSLAETAPALCGGNATFASQVVPVCLHLMCERVDDEDWLKQTGFEDDDEEDGMGGIAVAGEGALDRLSMALSEYGALASTARR